MVCWTDLDQGYNCLDFYALQTEMLYPIFQEWVQHFL